MTQRVVTSALERAHRRAVAERDAEILARTGADPELVGLAEHAIELSCALALILTARAHSGSATLHPSRRARA